MPQVFFIRQCGLVLGQDSTSDCGHVTQQINRHHCQRSGWGQIATINIRDVPIRTVRLFHGSRHH